jgi:hypothetical protein
VERAIGLPIFLAAYFTSISVYQNIHHRILGLLTIYVLQRILGFPSGSYEEFYILGYACYLLHTGFLFGLFFSREDGGDMSSETSDYTA